MADQYTMLQSRPFPLPPHRTQLHPRMLFPAPPKSPNHHQHRARFPLFLLSPLLLLPLLLLSRRLASPVPPSPTSFSLLLSASPRSSSVRVFQLLNGAPFLPDAAAAASASVRPGIGALAANPGAAARQIAVLLGHARGAVPRAEWRRTEVRLLESGALRGVAEEEARRVMEECRRVLRSSGFVFRDEWARSISGKERGIYAWVAANYLLGSFGGNAQETTGVVEFEEATARVTFSSSKKPPREFSYTLKLPRVTYYLYTRSTYQFEQEEVWNLLEKIHEHKTFPPFSLSTGSAVGTRMEACIPKGYSQTYKLQITSNSTNLNRPADTWGNVSECRFQSLRLLKARKDICLQQNCEMLAELLANLPGENDMAERILYTSELFGVFPRASLVDLENSAKHYCEDDWVELQEHFHADETDLLKYCYLSSYLLAFLHDNLGIPMERQSVSLTNHSGNAPLDWTLGAFILLTVAEAGKEPDNLNHNTGDDSLTYILLCIIFLLLLLVIFFVWRSQKPQLKMIYDLSQGHYIVTRQ